MHSCPLELCLPFLLACWDDGCFMCCLDREHINVRRNWWCDQCEHCCVSITALGWELIAGDIQLYLGTSVMCFSPQFLIQ